MCHHRRQPQRLHALPRTDALTPVQADEPTAGKNEARLCAPQRHTSAGRPPQATSRHLPRHACATTKTTDVKEVTHTRSACVVGECGAQAQWFLVSRGPSGEVSLGVGRAALASSSACPAGSTPSLPVLGPVLPVERRGKAELESWCRPRCRGAWAVIGGPVRGVVILAGECEAKRVWGVCVCVCSELVLGNRELGLGSTVCHAGSSC